MSINNDPISPPPTKRKRRESTSNPSPTTSTPTPPTTTSLSIYTWNINGIQPFLQKPITSFFSNSNTATTPTQTASLRAFLRRHNWPTLLFLQEVKISPSDTSTQASVRSAIRAPPNTSEPDYSAFFSLPRDAHNARGFGRKIYGVCSIVMTSFLASQRVSVRDVDWDLEGRVQVVETNPAPELALPKLCLLNIYAVNGTENVYRDSQTGEVVGTRHDRKLAFQKALLGECKEREEEGFKVVVAGDMNVARGLLDGWPGLRTVPVRHVVNRKDFNRKFFEDEEGFRGVDVFRMVHGDRRAYTYYPRGRTWGESCDRVDLIICSKELGEYVQEADILESAAERGPSDHVPLFAKFTFEDNSRKSRKLNEDADT